MIYICLVLCVEKIMFYFYVIINVFCLVFLINTYFFKVRILALIINYDQTDY